MMTKRPSFILYVICLSFCLVSFVLPCSHATENSKWDIGMIWNGGISKACKDAYGIDIEDIIGFFAYEMDQRTISELIRSWIKNEKFDVVGNRKGDIDKVWNRDIIVWNREISKVYKDEYGIDIEDVIDFFEGFVDRQTLIELRKRGRIEVFLKLEYREPTPIFSDLPFPLEPYPEVEMKVYCGGKFCSVIGMLSSKWVIKKSEPPPRVLFGISH